jgi:FMN phosphatase YigB (HAD superfamily)
MYQQVAETLLESSIFGISLDKIDVEAYYSIETMC